MADSVRILFKQDTFLKQEPVQSSMLPSNKIQKIPQGTLLVLDSYERPANNHIRISLDSLKFKGLRMNWYAFEGHITIVQEQIQAVESISKSLSKQQAKNTLKVTTYNNPDQECPLKLIINTDTKLKRAPVDSRYLSEDSIQKVPVGTELVILGQKPKADKVLELPIEDSHFKFSLKDLEFKGFSQDWYVYVDHAGVQILG
ncbi:MAG: hypothetical protein F6K58_29190 [Symploca sp. SIO2E9]|nr:hypothetical protein [Symploca sp. SIO2E9]